jgi:choice-of-anchor A domain-containing protein
MKKSILLWLSVLIAAPLSGQAGLFGFGKDKDQKIEKKVADRYHEDGEPLPENHEPMRNLINGQRRFVLYNSRRLTGECLETCVSYPTDAPAEKPSTDIGGETGSPTLAPPPGDLDCATLQNLGYGFSEPTGENHYVGCYPHVQTLDAHNLNGRDDSVAVFVGGDFISHVGAEVEGKVVVLGKLEVRGGGVSNMVSVGLGSHVVPNSGTDCIIVGGDLIAHRQVQMFNQAASMYCDIVYKGLATNRNNWATNGQITHKPEYDMFFYEKMTYVWRNKSEYWATLPSTGTVTESYTTTTFTCIGDSDLQVFNINGENVAEWEVFTRATSYKFTPSCQGKTILVNGQGHGTLTVNAADIYGWDNSVGHQQFNTCFNQNIMWNFPHASKVVLGNGSSEWNGSLLVTGDLDFETTGHSGRTIVLGNLYQNKGGSEFHSYSFNPSTPLPDPDDVCVIPDNFTRSPTGTPTKNPTNSPTITPPTFANGECTAIPQSRLPHGSWATNNNQCGQCKPPTDVFWWPCDSDPPLCEGNCDLA